MIKAGGGAETEETRGKKGEGFVSNDVEDARSRGGKKEKEENAGRRVLTASPPMGMTHQPVKKSPKRGTRKGDRLKTNQK